MPNPNGGGILLGFAVLTPTYEIDFEHSS